MARRHSRAKIVFANEHGRRLHAALGAIRVPNTHEARRGAKAFLLGEEANLSCRVPRAKGEPRICNIESTGTELRVKGDVIAKRSAPNTDVVEVCVANAGKPDQRYAASAVMSALKAGITVRDAKGVLVISGRKGRSKAQWPGCVVVKVPKKVREAAAKSIATRLTLREAEKAAKAKRSAAARKAAKTRRGKRPGAGKPYKAPKRG